MGEVYVIRRGPKRGQGEYRYGVDGDWCTDVRFATRYRDRRIALAIVGCCDLGPARIVRLRPARSKPSRIASARVVSAPGAAITETEYELTPEGKAALTVGVTEDPFTVLPKLEFDDLIEELAALRKVESAARRTAEAIESQDTFRLGVALRDALTELDAVRREGGKG